ncbi:type I restriction enzyme S subunit [Halanaerobium saccharolyticum]|jgi:type I restriction enzyme S subunit|uniref:Type I restriction enzyme S subunit n=1 Tax=Halanaerobium saccharolyticum TaxID=43595 RepID=A0A2T5RNS9_9FIRM|nr:restriction endonuclease subunit S [Halanaerobium saccharolyticum]PTW01324.1 type I restriction enzyme S subunit [Halanaerobium saccharolyticum]
MVKEVYVNAQKKKIPENWSIKTIGDVCEYMAGSTFPKNEQGNEKGDIPFYKVSDMNKFRKYMGEANNYISEKTANDLNVKTCPSGTVIFPKLGQALLTNKRRVLSRNSAFDNNVAGLMANEVDADFLYYFLLSLKFDALSNPGTVPSLTKKAINSIDVIYPSLSEQKTIASILSSVDKSIENAVEVIKETKVLKKGLMQELLTKGIGNREFKEVRLGVKKIKIPISWKVKKLKEITKKISVGIATGATDHYRDKGVPLIRNTNIKKGYLDDTELKYISPDFDNKNKNKRIRYNDVIIVRTGYAGLACKVPEKYDGVQTFTTLIVRPLQAVLDSDYLVKNINSYLGTSQVERIQVGGGRSNLNVGNLKDYYLPVPPLEEQKQIASILSSVDSKIKKEEEYKAKLERLKKGLMQKLLTGEIRVNTDMEV